MESLIGGALGWLGTLGTFSAYVLMLRGSVLPTAKRYLALNAVGGLLGAIGAIAYGAWPAAFSSIAWAVMALYGLAMALRKRRVRADPQATFAPVTESIPLEQLCFTAPIPIWNPRSTEASSIPLPWLGDDRAPQRTERIAA